MFPEKEEELLRALTGREPDYRTARSLIKEGANVNGQEGCLFAKIILDTEGEDVSLRNARFLIRNGFDARKNGEHALSEMLYDESGRRIFDVMKLLLSAGLDRAGLETLTDLLSSVGTKESYSICCEQQIEKNNLYYAAYELLDAALRKRPYKEIGIWEDCIGLRIDQICSSWRSRETTYRDSGRIILQKPLYLRCGGKTVVIQGRPNIFLQSWEEVKHGRKLASLDLFDEMIGAVITDVQFAFRVIDCNDAEWTQPVITLVLDNGRQVRFSSNSGEVRRCLIRTYCVIE